MIIELSPELEARVKEWEQEFGRPGEDLAVELLQEYFDDSDTGRAISEAVRIREENNGGEYHDIRA